LQVHFLKLKLRVPQLGLPLMWQLLQLQPVADTQSMRFCDDGMQSRGTVVAHNRGKSAEMQFWPFEAVSWPELFCDEGTVNSSACTYSICEA